MKHYPEVETGKCEHLHDQIPEVIYQYQMDDFTFLCFLAQKASTALWITDDGKVSFGQINYQKSFSNSKNILERYTMADYQQEEISILTMEQMPSGAVLQYQGKPYIIYQSEVTEEHQEAYFRYYASTVPSCYNHPILLNHWTAEAEVMDNQDRENLGRIQVKLNDWQDEDTYRVWIPYLSPYVGKNHGGIVMLPDIGDTVILHMLDGFFYAVGSIRKKVLPNHCQKIEQKFFSMKNTLITLDETQIQFTEGEKSKFIMTEQQLNAEHEKTKFTLQQNAEILETEKARLKIDTDTISAQTGDSILKLETISVTAQNGSGKLQLENQKAVLSGSETKLSLNSGNAELNGTQINLNTQAFSS